MSSDGTQAQTRIITAGERRSAYCPGIAARAGPSMNGSTPVQRERLCGDRRRIVVADRPGAARTAGGYAGEHRLTGAATWAWAWHDLPAGAVPAHDQRPPDGAVGVSADRPRIAI